ncbi:MAG TPA: acyl carrier protein [Jatrophihabitans sp.]|nr:acyl carrier protein [Jatrophihabitans sp.]
MDSDFPAVLRPFLKYAGTHEINADTSLREMGLDSMRAIELLFAIEDTYAVAMPDEFLTDMTFETAGNLWGIIASLQSGSERP